MIKQTGNQGSCVSEYRRKSAELQVLVDAFESNRQLSGRQVLWSDIESAKNELAQFAIEHDISSADIQSHYSRKAIKCRSVADAIAAMEVFSIGKLN